MQGEGGGGLTYAVVTDELLAAARAVYAVTVTASSATVEGLPATVGEVGHAGLTEAFYDFCGRWDTGLSHLVGDSEAMAARLEDCAAAYVENEDEAQGRYQQLLTWSPATASLPPPVVYPGGL